MDFVSPSESAPTPSFILCISESFSQRGRNFLPIGVEFRNLSVLRSGVQLNYVTWGSCQNTGLFSVSNHETTRGNLMSRYLRLETPVHMCFTKEGCQGGYTFHKNFIFPISCKLIKIKDYIFLFLYLDNYLAHNRPNYTMYIKKMTLY